MNNYENGIFEFGNEKVEEDALKSSNDFNYDSISGLGESNYENDDLFKNENSIDIDDNIENYNEFNFGVEDNSNYQNELIGTQKEDNPYEENNSIYNDDIDIIEPIKNENKAETDDIMLDPTQLEIPIDYQIEDLSSKAENGISKEIPIENNESKIEMSDTPIEELQSLTDYKDDKIEEMDINALFDKVSINVKGASEIFKRNTEMKEKIDMRFEELKKLQSEVENAKKNQIDEINSYKDEVFSKLTEKKEEIEKRLNTLKDLQASLEREKSEFEEYKKKEQEKIEKVQKDVQSAYDDRREELGHIEDTLRKQKDALDEERNQLSLDKIQYEADKNDLANNILKFNELVDSFTSGVNGVTGESV